MRARNNRIFGALNEIAAAHGPIKEYSERIDGALAERGYKWHERDEIARRLENGYAVEAYSSHSTVAGTPAQVALDAELRSQGYQPTIVNRADHYKTLASARAALEKSAERLNLLAIDDPAAAQKELQLRLPITRSFDGTNGIVPPYASSDAIERGEIEIFCPAGDDKIENGNDHDASRQDSSAEVVPPGIPTAAAATAAEAADSAASKPNGADDAIDQSTAAAPTNIAAEGVDLSPEPSENVSAPGADNAEKRHHLPRPLPLRPSKEATNAQSMKRSPLARITTIDHLVQELIRRKTTPPKPSKDGTQGKAPWNDKTARQVRGVGQLFAAVVGSDDLSAIEPAHIATYRRTIDQLPVSFGQSSIKRTWTLDEIFEDAEDLPPEQIGRAAGTINRHLNQLGAILKAAGSEGYKIPDLQELLRAQREAEPDKEAPTFVCEEVRVLADGCAQVSAPSLYWVTLLCMYSGARRSELCGLRIVEIDLIKGVIILEPNSYRGLKTPRSRRRIPLHPELIRLGFLEYVKKIAATGSDLLFPDLRERGENTPLGDLFGKQFEKLITEVLPEARANGKTFHSLRHYVNSELIKALVLDVTRYKIMGHKSGDQNGKSVGKDVNIDVYSHFDDETLLRAISTLPAVTSTLEPRIW